MLRPLALLKGYMHLFSRIGLPAAVGTAPAPVRKARNRPQHEGRQAKLDTRCTDYEVAEGKEVFQRQPGAPLQVSD